MIERCDDPDCPGCGQKFETLKEYENIQTRAHDNHFQVLQAGKIVFEEIGAWAPRNADGVFLKLRKKLRDKKPPAPKLRVKPAIDWTDNEVIHYAISMADAGAAPTRKAARANYVELYRKLAIKQGY